MSALHDVDLDLLRLLCAVHRHRSATRAAGDLGVTQSAVSHGLRRLRDQLQDPLFVRAGREMRPTPRADRLVRRVEPHLHAIAGILEEPQDFQPETSERCFRIAGIDLLDQLLVAPFVRRLEEQAPGVRLEVRAYDGSTRERFARGELDAALNPILAGAAEALRPGAGFRQRTMFWDGFSLFTPAALPPFEDLASLCAARHLLVAPGTGPGVVDRALAELGLERRVVVRKTSFTGTMRMVRDAGLVMIAPASFGAIAPPGVRVSPVPLELPTVQVTLVWPERLHADPGHRWFRDQLIAVGQELAAGL